MGELTLDQFSNALPIGLRKTVAPGIMDTINSLGSSDEVFRETYRDNLLSYAGVMESGKFKMTDYVPAVKYVSSKLLGHTNMESYIAALPDR